MTDGDWKLSGQQNFLLAYYFLIFGIIGGLNTQTAFQTLSWAGSGSLTVPSIIGNFSFNNIELWYFLAGIIFIIPLPIFLGLFVYFYVQNKIYVNSKLRLILEFFYLSVAGSFSMVAIRIPKILLVHVAGIDPNYGYQQDIMIKKEMTMADWTLELSSVTDTLNYEIMGSIVLIGLYFLFLLGLNQLRKRGLKNKF